MSAVIPTDLNKANNVEPVSNLPKSIQSKSITENSSANADVFDDLPLDGFLNIYHPKGLTDENHRFKKDKQQGPLRPIT